MPIPATNINYKVRNPVKTSHSKGSRSKEKLVKQLNLDQNEPTENYGIQNGIMNDESHNNGNMALNSVRMIDQQHDLSSQGLKITVNANRR